MRRPLRADRSVVRDLHVRAIRLVADAEREYGGLDLRLEGGTALAAYHLRHRESEDLDFFEPPDRLFDTTRLKTAQWPLIDLPGHATRVRDYAKAPTRGATPKALLVEIA